MRATDTTALVVGCGAAGVTAAIGLARRGVSVVVVEGAPYPGAENWSGAVYFCENLVRPEILGPRLLDQTAIERRVVKRGLLATDGRVAVGAAIHSRATFEHCYTVLRPVFDHDLAQRARQLGAEILSNTTALALIRDQDRVLGVLTDRGPIYADVVFLAEGDASHLVAREGLESKPASERGLAEPEFLQGIKEVLALPPQVIEKRFGVGAGDGACYEILLRNGSFGGRPVPLNAGAFLYTNRESLSLGLVAPLENLKQFEGEHNRLMEWLKQLPALRPLLEGAVQQSFGTKLIRGGGYREMPRVVLDGLVVGGAAAGLGVDFPCPNYTGPATFCGWQFSEAVSRIVTEKRSFDAATLTELYQKPVEASHYFADVRHLQDWPHFVTSTREFFGRQVDLVAASAHILTDPEAGRIGRHFLFPRNLVETLPWGKVGAFQADVRRAGDALGISRGAVGAALASLPRWILNVVLQFLPSRSHSGAAFEPIFVADPATKRLAPPLSVRFMRWRFAGAMADALHHLYRNDPVPVSEKLVAARGAILRRVSLLDVVVLPLVLLFNYLVGWVHQLGFKLWVGLTKPSLARILATPFFKVRESARALGDYGRTRELVAHDDKLAMITYRSDERSHIAFHVGYDKVGLPDVASSVFHVCPAHVYRREQDQSLASSVTVLHENCIKCETCWRADPVRVDWGRTRGQRLVFEAYSSADSWLGESLEAAAVSDIERGDQPQGTPSPNRANEPIVPVTIDDARRERVVARLGRLRAAVATFRPLHERLPAVMLGADQELLDGILGEIFGALQEVEDDLRPLPDEGLKLRLDAITAWRHLAATRRKTRRFFQVEADLELLRIHHLPDLEARLGIEAPAAPKNPPDWGHVRASLRAELERRLDKHVITATEKGRAPTTEALDVLRWGIGGLIAAGASQLPPLPGTTARDIFVEELARVSPSLAITAVQHLLAVDCLTRFVVDSDAEDLAEIQDAVTRVKALATVVIGDFDLDADGALRGEAQVASLGGAKIVLIEVDGNLALVAPGDPGLTIEAPGSLGLCGAGLARVRADGARPRAVFGPISATRWKNTRGDLDLVAVVRGMTDYFASRALDHATSRVQFPGLFRDVRGRDGIAKFGAVQAMLAGITSTRALLESLRGAQVHAAAAAALATELLGPGPRSVSYLAGQVLGGTAFSEEDPVCRHFRDAATLTRYPRDAETSARRHGRRQSRLVRVPAASDAGVIMGLDRRAIDLKRRPTDPDDLATHLDAVWSGWRVLVDAMIAADDASLDAAAGDLGRLTLVTGAFRIFADRVREARLRGDVDPIDDAALSSWARRLAASARKLARRLPDVTDLVELGRRLLRDGAAEGPTGAVGASYADYLDAKQEFTSGDLVTRPGIPGDLCYTPELLEADPSLAKAHSDAYAAFHGRWREHLFDGLSYPRYVERQHHVPLVDVQWLLDMGCFRMVIPERYLGQGKKKAYYYVTCTNLMRHGDPAHALIVMGSTSIGTTPILIGLDQDLPAARGAIEEALKHPERVRDVSARIDRLLRMADGADALKIKEPFQELAGVVKKSLQGEKVLRLVFQGFLDAFMDAGRAGLKRDLAGFRDGLVRAQAALAGFEERLRAELDSIPHREAMHGFYLKSISSGRISAFALTEPSAGSDTARIRTRAEPVEVDAWPDPRGFYSFVPAGGKETRNLFTVDRLEFSESGLRFVTPDGTRVPVEVRDFRSADGDGEARYRYVMLDGQRVDVHDIGRVTHADGKVKFPYFRVNGAKMWITNGSCAGVMSLYARTDRGPTGFMLDCHQEGLSIGKDEEKMGQRGSSTNELALKDVRIPVDAVIGIEGRGQENALETLNVGRAGLSITAVGLMHEVVHDVQDLFARNAREATNADLYQLGKMALDLAGSESLAYQLVGRFDHHGTKSIRVESAIAKAETSEALHRVLRRAERIAGPTAVLAESELEKRRRDARVLTIYEGTNEVQRFLILKDLIDVLPVELPPIERGGVSTAGVAAAMDSLAVARESVAKQAAAVRANLGSRAWQNVHLQPWLFPLVETYMATAVLSASMRRLALAQKLITSEQGRARVEYLDRAVALLSRSVAAQDKLAEFQAEAERIKRGGDTSAQSLADRAILAHEARHVRRAPPPPSVLRRPVRVLVVIDPEPAVAPHPRIRGRHLSESLIELGRADRGVLAAAFALRKAGDVDVTVLGAGGAAAVGVMEECLALGADRAFLVSLGTRSLLAPDLAEFGAEIIRTQEELRGTFDVVLGADRSSELLLPLARRLDLDVVRVAETVALEVDTDDVVVRARLAKPATLVAVPGPALVLMAAEVSADELRFGTEGWRRARGEAVHVIDFVPRDAIDGSLILASAATSEGTREVAGGQLTAADAAASFAREAQLGGGAGERARPHAGAFEEKTVPAFVARNGVLAIVMMSGTDGLRSDAVSVARAGQWYADHVQRPFGVIVLTSAADDVAVREAVGALGAAVPRGDIGVLVEPLLPSLPDGALGKYLESLTSEATGSLFFGAELRAAALLASEGRTLNVGGLPVVNGIDRIETIGGRVVLSGARHDGRARYVVEWDSLRIFQLIARGEMETGGDVPAAFERGERLVARVSIASPIVDDADDLVRALREAQGELGVGSLADAEFIIDVGYGVGSRDGIEEVIDPLKAALERMGVPKVTIGASRKVTQDLGLLPDSFQIGQTGVPVNPKIMLAIGISGAPQHLNYIGERAAIFAFNRDPEAPLMVLNRSRPKPRVFPIHGDLFAEVPKFVRALESEIAVGARG